jgi:uncharacterized Zn finger protein
MANDLSRAMSDAVMRRLAKDDAYLRGVDYDLHGQVESVEEIGDAVRAMVRGNRDYTVELSSEDGVLDYSCDCPPGRDGAFCKHCVAAALAWLNRAAAPASSKRRGKARVITLAGARQTLLAEDKETIVEALLEWAKTDKQLREQLILFAARRTGAETALAAVRKAFEQAVRVRGYVGYREMRSYARGVGTAIDSIEQLLRDGQAAGVVELCEAALGSLMEAAGSVDDSDGYMSTLRDRLQEIHYSACLEARPEPIALATRLFRWEMQENFDVFHGAPSRYAEILGPKGMHAYRTLAEAEWAKVPAQTSESASGFARHFPITRIMESLARLSGDVEQLVAVMSRDLAHAYGYWRIAMVYREAGQLDQALLWAEKGLQAFPERTDERLREFAAEEYHRRGRHAEAMPLIWAGFLGRACLETYRTLERHGTRAGNWAEWRARALAEFRRRIEVIRSKHRGANQPRWMQPDADHSALVEIFLYEKDVQAAWEEAQAGDCSSRLWLQLADARQPDHPDEAVPIYLKRAEPAIVSSQYEDAVSLLVKAAALMKRLGKSEEFVRYLESLRVKHKARRNFIKLLEERRSSLY